MAHGATTAAAAVTAAASAISRSVSRARSFIQFMRSRLSLGIHRPRSFIAITMSVHYSPFHNPLEHDPEKWIPVFRKDHAPARNLDHGPILVSSDHGLGLFDGPFGLHYSPTRYLADNAYP